MMSMVQELIMAVAGAERQLDDQIMKLHSYDGQIDQVMQRVEAAFSGSTREYGREMLGQLSATKAQVRDTMEKLQVAKDKLMQVRMI